MLQRWMKSHHLVIVKTRSGFTISTKSFTTRTSFTKSEEQVVVQIIIENNKVSSYIEIGEMQAEGNILKEKIIHISTMRKNVATCELRKKGPWTFKVDKMIYILPD